MEYIIFGLLAFLFIKNKPVNAATIISKTNSTLPTTTTIKSTTASNVNNISGVDTGIGKEILNSNLVQGIKNDAGSAVIDKVNSVSGVQDIVDTGSGIKTAIAGTVVGGVAVAGGAALLGNFISKLNNLGTDFEDETGKVRKFSDADKEISRACLIRIKARYVNWTLDQKIRMTNYGGLYNHIVNLWLWAIGDIQNSASGFIENLQKWEKGDNTQGSIKIVFYYIGKVGYFKTDKVNITEDYIFENAKAYTLDEIRKGGSSIGLISVGK